MRMKSVSALFLVLGGFALIGFETSFYGVSPLAAAPRTKASTQMAAAKTKSTEPSQPHGTHYGTMMREGSG
ncbi:MAG: hypothetical protein WAK91_13650 [Candidatus Acidiferrales bacterium]|jgi:hypothetical protein